MEAVQAQGPWDSAVLKKHGWCQVRRLILVHHFIMITFTRDDVDIEELIL